MTGSPKNVVCKAIFVSARVAISAVLCAGMLWGTSASAGNTTYQYDALGRVIKVTYPDSKQICYAYDSAGNRTQVNRQATGTCTVTGSTLSSAMTAETMSMALEPDVLQADSATVSATDSQVTTDAVTDTAPTEETATTN
ncbi:YD repeat-containing protein [Asticcacaulis taihuensis]|uniref:RHS repeat domain-containing protein n=1 Tax=Asticcacaulis taihuensis TaxID=260084 RepID=UPI0039EAB4F0